MIDYGFGVMLDCLKASHVPLYRHVRNTPEVWKWARQNDLISELQQEHWFEKQALDSSCRLYEIIAKDLHVGVCGLSNIDHVHQKAEFSIYIFPGQLRQGYAKNGLKTLFTHGFRNLNLNLIYGESFEDNPAIQLFEGLGMKCEGYRRSFYFKDGKFINAGLFSILRDEWKY